jgi:ATP-dependent DNA helicase DinG
MQTAADVLSDQGPVGALIDGFRVRPEQQAMAEAIHAAIRKHDSLICEAGTGTGKTFAYLVPALLAGRKVLISTGTRHLQDQLHQRDLPLIRQALGVPVKTALLKGRANYLCRHRLEQAGQDTRLLNRKGVSQLHDIRQWSHQTGSGDLAELTDIPEEAPVRYAVTSTVDNCLGQECDHYADCFVYKARQHAGESDIVIVNHHLFLADMSLREGGHGELLPAADIVIFDEAHKLPELASEFFSRVLSSRQLLELARDCRAAYHAEAADLPEFPALLGAMEKSVLDLRLAFGSGDQRSSWHQVYAGAAVQQALTLLLRKGQDLHQVLEDFADRGKRLENCCARIAAALNQLDEFTDTGSSDSIQWLETRGQGFLLYQTPLDIAPLFHARITASGCVCIFTSATLSVNGDFSHFSGQLGLADVRVEAWDSPFDYRSQTLCYLPEGMPDPRADSYTGRVIEMAIPVIKLTRGRAFLLFTSHRALNQAAAIISSRLDYPILVQGEAPRTELLESFRRREHAVLLGTSSFWEGVDVRGQALSCVIIDKLPFAAPDDPVLQARMRRLEEQGGNPFRDFQLPEAVLTLKQGIGRLIRDSNDYGVLMLCDPRLKTRSYGKVFINSLPDMIYTRDLAEVEKFFTAHENKN